MRNYKKVDRIDTSCCKIIYSCERSAPITKYVSFAHGCLPKTVTRGLCCKIYVDQAFNHAHFCMYDNNVLAKAVHVDVLNEGIRKNTVVAFFILLIEEYVSCLLLWKMRNYELMQSKRCWKKGS